MDKYGESSLRVARSWGEQGQGWGVLVNVCGVSFPVMKVAWNYRRVMFAHT